ncbi:hypothetical protein QAD02_023926 [Eretmocerus hayati]|uniref:Uncharacterized protein n=1 Tax=Eretmocerus hayati TaxID=131215 RepID=A0ACC2PX72_9HYME|nr:hypothetical protein QAD02_023926 [Eretmocerus hayati]
MGQFKAQQRDYRREILRMTRLKHAFEACFAEYERVLTVKEVGPCIRGEKPKWEYRRRLVERSWERYVDDKNKDRDSKELRPAYFYNMVLYFSNARLRCLPFGYFSQFFIIGWFIATGTIEGVPQVLGLVPLLSVVYVKFDKTGEYWLVSVRIYMKGKIEVNFEDSSKTLKQYEHHIFVNDPGVARVTREYDKRKTPKFLTEFDLEIKDIHDLCRKTKIQP